MDRIPPAGEAAVARPLALQSNRERPRGRRLVSGASGVKRGPDLRKLTPTEKMAGDDEEDTRLLQELLQKATDFIQSHRWCPPIERIYFGDGVGGVIAAFLFKFGSPIQGSPGDDRLWVVVGDMPSVYLVVDTAPDAAAAIEVYCELMDDWSQAVLDDRSLEKVFPVAAPPTKANARALMSRLKFLREKIIPPRFRRDGS